MSDDKKQVKTTEEKSNKEISKKEKSIMSENDEFVQAGMKPLTDEQLDMAVGGLCR